MHISRFSMSSLTVEAPKVLSAPFSIPEKTMMGPGPTNVPERIRKAMALPTIGHLHPEFCKVIFPWNQFSIWVIQYSEFEEYMQSVEITEILFHAFLVKIPWK